jgi:hypothetical protein
MKEAPRDRSTKQHQAGQCYLTVNGQVARVVKRLPDGGVHYQFRDAALAKAFGWHSGNTTVETFALMVERACHVTGR